MLNQVSVNVHAGNTPGSANIEYAGLSQVSQRGSSDSSHVSQERSSREPVATSKSEHGERSLDRLLDSNRDTRRDVGVGENFSAQFRAGQAPFVANGNPGTSDTTVTDISTRRTDHLVRNSGMTQGKDEVPAQAERSGSSPILGEILRQHDRVLQISQNATASQMEAQAVMAQQGARIDQLVAQQRQLQANWRKLRMEEQNRTQQNMGGI